MDETNKCSFCGNLAPFHKRTCPICETDLGFPNVRKAESEEKELRTRYESAKTSAKARGISIALDDFEVALSKSVAVLARSVKQMIDLINNENLLHTTFAKQVRANARLAEDNRWDSSRDSVESALHPIYHDEIVYSVLSLSNIGASYYGNCHIVLKTEYIEKRASLFQENPFIFFERYQVIIGKSIPKGFRANWKNRSLLAVAKLHSEINITTKEDEYPGILMNNSGEDTDYIEVHIYGSIHAIAFKIITLTGTLSPAERALLNASSSKFEELNIDVVDEAA
ncbi:MAG: hypothetical protein AB2710_00030 [Candidatus Thiodiazotropha sp.]